MRSALKTYIQILGLLLACGITVSASQKVGEDERQMPVRRLQLVPRTEVAAVPEEPVVSKTGTVPPQQKSEVQSQIQPQAQLQTLPEVRPQTPQRVLRLTPKRPPFVWWHEVKIWDVIPERRVLALEMPTSEVEPVAMPEMYIPKIAQPYVELFVPGRGTDRIELAQMDVPEVTVPRVKIMSMLQPVVPLWDVIPERRVLALETLPEIVVAHVGVPKFKTPKVWEPEVPIWVVPKKRVPEFELVQVEVPEIYVPELEVEKFYVLAWPVEYLRLKDSVLTVAKVRKPIRVLGVTMPHLELKKRMDRDIKSYLFVPKNTWLAGVQFSFWDENLQDYDLLQLLGNWDMGFKSLSIAPYGAYLLKDDLAVGASFKYRNNTIRIDNLDFEFGDDFSLDLKNFYLAEKLYSASVFMRIFVGLGPGKRIGLFNDVVLTYGRGTGKIYSGRNSPPMDVRQTIDMWNIGIKPGLIAFITNNISLEASLGLLGFQYRNTKLFENGEQIGSRQASKANFKSDILSLNLGLSLYLH